VTYCYTKSEEPIDIALDERLERIAAAYGGEPGDCGSGFGERDSSFSFPSWDAATCFAKAVLDSDLARVTGISRRKDRR
jgi:hypothetical protein